jgi:molybdopterin molybdotransferase
VSAQTPFAEALAIVRAAARALPSEEVPLGDALARVLANDVTSLSDVPRFANSAMDGFAVRAAATPGRFAIGSQLVAGEAALAHSVSEERAVEIMTGAPLPPGADAVVKVEDVIKQDGFVQTPAVAARNNVRAAGEDYRQGESVVAKGTRLSPEHLLAIAQTGSGVVSVAVRPRVAVIPTGLELEPPGAALHNPASIWSSSAIYLQSALEGAGCIASVFPIVRDDAAVFETTVKAALEQNDVVISTGAVSMGVHDFIPASLTRLGAHTHFRKLAIRPAKPVVFAELGGKIIFALPGNPISTVVAFRFLVWAALARMLGLEDETPRRLPLSDATKKPSGLRCFFKAHSDHTSVRVTPGQGSHLVRPLVSANAWAVLEEARDVVEAGTLVDVYALQPFGAA